MINEKTNLKAVAIINIIENNFHFSRVLNCLIIIIYNSMVLRESYIPQQVQRRRSIRRRKESGVERENALLQREGTLQPLLKKGGGYTSEALFPLVIF